MISMSTWVERREGGRREGSGREGARRWGGRWKEEEGREPEGREAEGREEEGREPEGGEADGRRREIILSLQSLDGHCQYSKCFNIYRRFRKFVCYIFTDGISHRIILTVKFSRSTI